MTDLNEQLLPCPFCASDDLDNQVSEFGNEFIQCRACGGDGPLASSAETAEAAWNRRAPAAAPAPVAASEQDMMEWAVQAGLFPNTIHHWMPALRRYTDAALAAAPAPAAAPIVQPVADERAAFEAWWSEFTAEHDDWRYADSSALRWAAWQGRAALTTSTADAAALDQRAIGRGEALAILMGLNAEDGIDEYIGSHPVGCDGEWDAHWKENSLRSLFRVDDRTWSFVQAAEDRLNAALWDQAAMDMDAEFFSGTPAATSTADAKDAARYRWLREQPGSTWKRIGFNTWNDEPAVFPYRDKEIDAAITSSAGEVKP